MNQVIFGDCHLQSLNCLLRKDHQVAAHLMLVLLFYSMIYVGLYELHVVLETK